MMEIVEQNGNFQVLEDGILVYSAISLDEAQGYVDWRNRADAGNTPEDCGCNQN
jgi:hypothetical protein